MPYKLISALTGVLSGLLARNMFKQGWKLATGDESVPKPTDAERRWTEILLAAVAEGVVAAVVKTVLDRAAAQATARLTGDWPEA